MCLKQTGYVAIKGVGDGKGFMDSLLLTYLLALCHLTVYVISLWLTRYPVLTLFHLCLVNWVIAFVVRPLLAASDGGYTLYYMASGMTWRAYNLGLIFQLLFALFYVAGYMLGRYGSYGKARDLTIRIGVRHYIINVMIGITAVALIHVLSRGMWLPSARGTTVTATAPFGKLLFGIAAITLSTSIPMAYLLCLRQRKLVLPMLVATVVVFILLVLLYQRGLALLGVLIVAWLYQRRKGLGYIRAGALAMALLLLAMSLRPLATWLITREAGTFPSVGTPMETIKSVLLYSPNFDNADVWPVVLEVAGEDGYRFGRTFISIPLRFLSPQFRQKTGLLTVVDELNAHYWGNKYWETNFGFNVTLPQELYFNFGIILLWLGVLPGLVTASLDRWLLRLKSFSALSVYLVGAAFMVGSFTGELAGSVQWGTAFLVAGLAVSILGRIRLAHRGATLNAKPVRSS